MASIGRDTLAVRHFAVMVNHSGLMPLASMKRAQFLISFRAGAHGHIARIARRSVLLPERFRTTQNRKDVKVPEKLNRTRPFGTRSAAGLIDAKVSCFAQTSAPINAQPMLREFATNAAKCCALKVSTGSVQVCWRRQDGNRLDQGRNAALRGPLCGHQG